MTNFLDRLAGRALGVTPVAQPIIPARFTATTERRGQLEMADAERTGSSIDERSSARTRNTFRLQENEASSPVVAELREPALPHTEGAEEAPRLRSILDPPVTTEVNTLRYPRDAASSAVPKDTGQRPQYQHAVDATVGSMPSAQTTIRREIQRAEVTENSSLRDQRIPHDMFDDRGRGAVARPVHNRVQRLVDPVSEQKSFSTPPVIRVTIGRIDVRAELASAPSPPIARSNRPSTLSLDQYLKRQGGEGR
jgi:hypothetical protein